MKTKTDIAALRSEAFGLSRLFEAEQFIEKLIGLLEAERQQREAAEKERDELRVWKKLAAQRYEKLQALREKLARPVVLGGRFKPGISKVELFKGAPVMVLDATGGWVNRAGVIAAIKEAGYQVQGE